MANNNNRNGGGNNNNNHNNGGGGGGNGGGGNGGGGNGGTNAGNGGNGGQNHNNNNGGNNNNNNNHNNGGGGGGGNGGTNAGNGGNGLGQNHNANNDNNNRNNNNHNNGGGNGGGNSVPRTPLGGGNFGTGNNGNGQNHNGNGGTNAGNGGGGVGQNHDAGGGTQVPRTPMGGGNFGTGNHGNNVAAGHPAGAGEVPRTPLGGGNFGTGNHGNNVGQGHAAGNGQNHNGNGGTTAPASAGPPVKVSSWTNNYQEWKKEHPNPGHSEHARQVNAPAGAEQWNENYHAWLAQHPNVGKANNHAGNHQHAGGSDNGGTTAPPDGSPGIGTASVAGSSGHHLHGGFGPGDGAGSDSTKPYPLPTGSNADDTGGAYGPATDANGQLDIGGDFGNATLPADPNQTQDDSTSTDTSGGAVASDGTDGNFQTASVVVGTNDAAPSAYVVNHGDTLSSIAEKYGVSLSHLESLNPQIKDPNLIYAGQSINLGDPGAGATFSSDGGGVSTASATFPTSSTYPPSDDAKTEAPSAVIDHSKHGWGSGTATTPDPASTATYVDAHQNTDPLKIKNDDHKSA